MIRNTAGRAIHEAKGCGVWSLLKKSPCRELAVPGRGLVTNPSNYIEVRLCYSSMYQFSMLYMIMMPISSVWPLGTFLMRVLVLVG